MKSGRRNELAGLGESHARKITVLPESLVGVLHLVSEVI